MTQPDVDGEQSPETPLSGAGLADRGIVRIGDTVRRPAGPWTASVHHLLRHLRSLGFDAAPEPLGTDEQGREILRFLPGRDQSWPFHEDILSAEGAQQLGSLARQLARSLASYVSPDDAQWQFGAGRVEPSQRIQHGDLGPWNLLWGRGPEVVGVLDWDFAGPYEPSYDLGYLAWFTVPLMDDERAHARGFPEPPDRRTRLSAFAAGAHTTATQVLAAGLSAQEAYERMVLERGGSGLAEQWAKLYSLGSHKNAARDRRWTRSQALL
jgi:hypothetical protein